MKKYTFRTTLHFTVDLDILADNEADAIEALNNRVINMKADELAGCLSSYDEDKMTEVEIDYNNISSCAEDIIRTAHENNIAFFMDDLHAATIERFDENNCYEDVNVYLHCEVSWDEEGEEIIFDTSYYGHVAEGELTKDELLPIYQDIINSAAKNGIDYETLTVTK